MREAIAGTRGFIIVTAAIAGLGVVGALPARVAAATAGYALPSNVTRECPAPTAGTFQCMALVRNDVSSSAPSGYGPTDLQSAYNLTSAAAAGGTGTTVAVLEVGDDPNAVSDFNTYREHYGLTACDTATGVGCLTVVNDSGNASPLPLANAAWAEQSSMDADMIAAVCPNCHVLLVEEPSTQDALVAGAAVTTDGAKVVVAGFGEPDAKQGLGLETLGFDGVAIVAAAGDDGYGVQYPASSQFVTAVGGTSLTPAQGTARGWTETAWAGTGSGCVSDQYKPSWQSDTGCAGRTQNDVAAVADPETGVAFYDSYDSGGWGEGGGTNVSADIVAAVYALAGAPEKWTYPAQYPYLAASDLYPVTSGDNGTCSPSYLCTAGTGYNGPGGLGAPDGTAAFAAPNGDDLTLHVRDLLEGSVGKSGQEAYLLAEDSGADPGMKFSATGLPPGVQVTGSCQVTQSACAAGIFGTPTKAGNYDITVTGTDDSGASGSLAFPVTLADTVTVGSLPNESVTLGNSVSVPFAATSASGDPLAFSVQGLPPGISYSQTGPDQITFTGTPTTLGTYTTTVTATNQAFGGSGTGSVGWIVHGTIALKPQANLTDAVGSSAALTIGATDSVKGAQLNYFMTGLPPGIYQGLASDTNVISGWLAKTGTYHVTLTVTDNYQASTSETFTWTVQDSASSETYGPIRLDLGGKCLDDGTGVRIWQCNGTGSQNWTIAQDGTIRGRGECLTESGANYGARVVLAKCTDATSQQWQAQEESVQSPDSLDGWAGPALVNVASGLCLGDPGGNHNGVYVEVLACNVGASKTWTTPAGPVENGIPGMCLADPANATANGTPIVLWQCNGWHEEDWTFEPDGTVRIHGKCLYVNPNSQANGDYARLETCNAENKGEQWADYGASPFGGTIYNPWNGNGLGTANSNPVNGQQVGTYASALQLSITWRPL